MSLLLQSGLLLENNYGIYYNHDIKWSITKLSNFIFLTTATNDFCGPLRYHTAEAASDEIKELQHSQHHIAWYELNKPARLSFSCSSLDLLLNEIKHQIKQIYRDIRDGNWLSSIAS